MVALFSCVCCGSLLICVRSGERSSDLYGNHLLFVHAGFPFMSFGVAVMGFFCPATCYV